MGIVSSLYNLVQVDMYMYVRINDKIIRSLWIYMDLCLLGGQK